MNTKLFFDMFQSDFYDSIYLLIFLSLVDRQMKQWNMLYESISSESTSGFIGWGDLLILGFQFCAAVLAVFFIQGRNLTWERFNDKK